MEMRRNGRGFLLVDVTQDSQFRGEGRSCMLTKDEITVRFTPVIDAALEGGRKLRVKLEAMRQALKDGDEANLKRARGS